MSTRALERSALSWNRSRLDLDSDEVLAQVHDRGDVEAWRELYALARQDPALRARIQRVVATAPLAYPRFWLAALVSLGEAVDWSAPLPRDDGPA